MEWNIEVLPVGPMQMNSVLLSGQGPQGLEIILIDPGDEPHVLLAKLDSLGGRLVALLATHGHFDHVGAAAAIQTRYDLPLRCHAEDLPIIQDMPTIQEVYGFPRTAIPHCQPDLVDGGRIPFADGEILVHHVPGHSPGQVMFCWAGQAIVGDCLFRGSVGRTDLPGGDFPTLEKSIRERIYTLPDETVVVCGHGPDTTVGLEKVHNPFVHT